MPIVVIIMFFMFLYIRNLKAAFNKSGGKSNDYFINQIGSSLTTGVNQEDFIGVNLQGTIRLTRLEYPQDPGAWTGTYSQFATKNLYVAYLTASVSGGFPAYTYKWFMNGAVWTYTSDTPDTAATDNAVLRYLPPNAIITCVVTDSLNQSVTTLSVQVTQAEITNFT